MLFPYAKSSISLIFVKKTQFSSLKKRLFNAYITKILGGIFLVCKNLSFGIVKSKIDHFRKVPCEHTVTCNTRFFGALVACQKKTQFAPFRRHSQFVAEFGQFLFHVLYECSVAHLVRASS